MAQNEQSHTASQGAHNQQTTDQEDVIHPDYISLRVIVLAHGANENNDLHLSLTLDTKISELKTQLQQSLQQHPLPSCQRLIYQGRPLLNDDATLRSILRRQSVSNNQVPAHVLHLVIREDQNQSTTPANRPLPDLVTPQIHQAPSGIIPSQTPQFPPAMQPQNIDLAQRLAQQQMNAFQQHMALHQQHLANAQPGLRQFLPGNVPQPHGIPRAVNPAQPLAATGNQSEVAQDNTSTPGVSSAPPNNVPENVHAHHAPASVTMRIEETVGPNGELIRTVIHGNNPLAQNHLAALQANPVERPASAPGWAQRTSSPIPSRQMPGGHVPNIWPTVPPQIPMIPSQFRSILNPAGASSVPPIRPHVGSPIVWLASSPSGPQALLFAPGHGMFTSAPPLQARQTSTDNLATSAPNTDSVRPTPTLHTEQNTIPDNARNVPQAQVIVRPQAQARDQAQPQGQPQARPRNREEDTLAFVLQRGWLFLRLYMFIYVLSEPYTWRRVILLSIAVIVCLLPHRNPLTEGFNIARRHVDNLIGPPQPPQRQGQAQQPPAQQNGVPRAATTNTRNQPGNREQGPMPSPEEHARRLLREHQAQNPNFFRGLLYSVEQAVALFLASLIPGVGERHVRAREDARRIVQEEEQRRQQQETEIQNNIESRPMNDGNATNTQGVDTGNGVAEVKTGEAQISGSGGDSTEVKAGSSTAVDTPAAATSDAASTEAGIRERLTRSDT